MQSYQIDEYYKSITNPLKPISMNQNFTRVNEVTQLTSIKLKQRLTDAQLKH